MKFQKIGLIGKHTNKNIKPSFNKVAKLLLAKNLSVYVEQSCRDFIEVNELKGMNLDNNLKFIDIEHMHKEIELGLVIGGDGSILRASNFFMQSCPIIGINEGSVGFLADIAKDKLEDSINAILDGEYKQENCSILKAEVIRENKLFEQGNSLNDIVLSSSDIARLIEFDILADNEKLYTARADGVVIATPNGSTAYSMSAGGPVLSPNLNALIVTPLNSYKLNIKPIVVSDNTVIELHLNKEKKSQARLSLDGQSTIELQYNDIIRITKHDKELNMLHLNEYNYFNKLKNKLGWN